MRKPSSYFHKPSQQHSTTTIDTNEDISCSGSSSVCHTNHCCEKDIEEDILRDERGHIFFQTQVCGMVLTTHLLTLQVLTWQDNDDPDTPPIRGPILMAIPAESIIGMSYTALEAVPNSYEIHIHLCPTTSEITRARYRSKEKTFGRTSSSLLSFWGTNTNGIGGGIGGSSSSAVGVNTGIGLGGLGGGTDMNSGSSYSRWLSGERHSDTLKFFYMEVSQDDCVIWWRAIQHLIRAPRGKRERGESTNNRALASLLMSDSGRILRSSSSSSWSADLSLPVTVPDYVNRKYLILLTDSHSDRHCWTHEVEPFCKLSSIDCHVLQLQSRLEMRAVLYDMCASLSQYNVIVMIGGDDFFSAIFQTIASQRNGFELLKSLSFATITPSRCNASGLQASIAYASRLMPSSSSSPINATFISLHGKPHSFDMSLITINHQTRLVSSLSQCWGVAADMAHASGSIAPLCLGIFGLFNGSMFQVLRNPIYRAELRMTLVDNINHSHEATSQSRSILRQGLQDRRLAEAMELNVLERSECESEEHVEVLVNERSSSSDRIDEEENASSECDTMDIDIDMESDRSSPPIEQPYNSKRQHHHHRIRRRKAFISGEFAFVWIVQTSHSSRSMFSGPGVRLNDGVFTVYLVKALPRSQLMEIMNALSEGKHVYHKALRVFQCVDYDLRMLDSEQIVMVDGIQYPCQHMHGEILPSVTQLMVLPNG